eukprot:5820943-Alexandrium_andersonii.AAC.1
MKAGCRKSVATAPFGAQGSCKDRCREFAPFQRMLAKHRASQARRVSWRVGASCPPSPRPRSSFW